MRFKKLTDHLIPVCAPSVGARLRDPRDLARATLLHDEDPLSSWPHWLDEISAKEAGYLKDYEACGWGKSGEGTVYPGNRGTSEPEDLFCMGGGALLGQNLATGQAMRPNPRAAFDYTRQAAESGYVPAQAALGILYANGKGVEQNYGESRKWFVKAAES